MKVHFEIDCTPTEAREFFGLPDVRAMHAEVMKRLEERMMKNLDALSPQDIMQNWFTFNATGAKQLQDLFSGFLVSGMSGASGRDEPGSRS